MSVRTRTVAAPSRVARRVQEAERVKSGAAQRAYARRRTRAEGGSDTVFLPTVRRSAMAARIPFVTAILALLGCGLALTLLLTTRAAEDSYQLGDARATNRRLADERAALQREVEAADSAPELAARARELGMIPAKDPARLLVGPDGSVTVIGKPTPAQGTPVPPLNAGPSARSPWGERVVPVTTTPGAAAPGQPNTGAQNNTQVNVTPAPGSPVPTPPAPVDPPQPGPSAPPADVPQPPEAASPQVEAAQPQAGPDGTPQ
ncbi:hypothetical protein IU486_32045 [Streptomyces gardneri]|uniref:hypothetical protein n=1 Tax=Nocardia TaxID=1817 RepID=UPI00135710E0|nr:MULTISPECIES: hypothetical protein [Nocardia]MBF6169328.1 hypothetical protein [Streptomyces gardneri]MBF6208942.1 hypothetical protein [Streptomyces gardneri]